MTVSRRLGSKKKAVLKWIEVKMVLYDTIFLVGFATFQ